MAKRAGYPLRRGVAALAAAGWLASCGPFGRVEQGIAIDYDPAARVVTLILDSNSSGSGDPQYDLLPPVQVRLPEDPRQMGPVPVTGRLLRLDPETGSLTIYNPRTGQIETVSTRILERLGNVYPDDARVSRGALPALDAARGALTLYSSKTREILVLELPPQYASLPPETWRAGDEMRYYYKQPGQALRMMNVTRTKLT
jgi:hypothetical protein